MRMPDSIGRAALTLTWAAVAAHGQCPVDFRPEAEYATAIYPFAIIVADVDGDEVLDLALAGDKVSILRGDGAGSFGASDDYSVGGGSHSLAAGNFNADAWLDLAVVILGESKVAVLLGTGDSTPGMAFGAPVLYETGGLPYFVAIADFDRDGNLDLATANSDADTVSILAGNGDGTFQSPHPVIRTLRAPLCLAAGDLNGDGWADLVVANYFGHHVSILLNDLNGSFEERVDYPVGDLPFSVITADFNNDHILDLAVPNTESKDVSILLGAGDGTFVHHDRPTLGAEADYAAADDFDSDGNLDLAVTSSGSGNVYILVGDGSGSFRTPPLAYPVGPYPYGIAAGRFHDCDRPGLAIAERGSHAASVRLSLTCDCPADFNCDGAADTLDVLAFLNAWTSHDPRADFNGDGVINTLDVLAFLNAWNAGC